MTDTHADPKMYEAMSHVRALADASVDAVIPQAGLRMMHAAALGEGAREQGADPVYLMAETMDGRIPLRVLDGAHEQIAAKLDIDLGYYRKLLTSEPDLLAANVNRWLTRDEAHNRLLRLVKPLPGEAPAPYEAVGSPFSLRAYLDDGYKVIDHYSALKALLPEMETRGATVEQFEMNPRRMYIRVTTPAIDLSHTYKVGETVAIGISLRNSETGHGAAAVEVFAKILRCANGMTVDEALRIIHKGKKQGADEDWISDQTRRVTSAADILKLRDRIRAGFSDKSQEKVARAIAEATGQKLDLPSPSAVIRFVQNVGTKYDLTKAEREALQDTTLEEMAQAGTTTSANRFTVSQAMTALARKAESFDRRVEIEKIGWRVLVDPIDALLKAEKAASN